MSYRDTVIKFLKTIQGQDFFVWDTETTGLSPTRCDIIEFSAIKYHEENGYFKYVDSCDFYINPGYHIPSNITKITGINDQMVKNGKSLQEAALAIRDFWGENPNLMGYNSISYDQAFVNSLYIKTMGIEFTPGAHIDVLNMAREKSEGSHKLIDMATKAGVADNIRFHSSIDDAKATFGVFIYLLPMYQKPEEKKLTITKVIQWEKGELNRLYINNKEGYNIYFDIQNKIWHIPNSLDEEYVKSTLQKEENVKMLNNLPIFIKNSIIL